MTYLYVHTSPNGKKYFGITDNPERRWKFDGNGYECNERLCEDIAIYGWDNIKHEIIDSFEDRQEAEKYEALYILLFNTENPQNGYNRTNIKEHLIKKYQKRTDVNFKVKSKKYSEYTTDQQDMVRRFNMPWSSLTLLIDEWIFNEKHRTILKRKIHDGVPFDKLSKEFGLSTQQCTNIVYRGLAELDKHA